MKIRVAVTLLLLLLSAISIFGQEKDPCASSATFGEFVTNLSTEVTDDFQKGTATKAKEDTKTELATRANGDGLTINRLDLLKRAFLAFDLGEVEEKNGDLVLNFNPDRLNFEHMGQFSPRIIAHRADLFTALSKKIDTLAEALRQNQKDALKKGIGELDDVEANLRWTNASGTPRAALQSVATALFEPKAVETQALAQDLANEIAATGRFIQQKLAKPSSDPIPISEICENRETKTQFIQFNKDMRAKGTRLLTDLKNALNGTLFFKLADLIDGQPKFSGEGAYRRRGNAAGPDERSLKVRFEMGEVSYWGLKRFAGGEKNINVAKVDEYFKDKNKSVPSFSANVDYIKTSDFKIPLSVYATQFHQAESRTISAAATGGLYFGEGRAHRLELKSSYDDVTDDPTRHDRFVNTLSWVEKLNPTLTQVLGGSDLTVTLVYSNKPEFRGEVNHELGLRAGLKWSLGGMSKK